MSTRNRNEELKRLDQGIKMCDSFYVSRTNTQNRYHMAKPAARQTLREFKRQNVVQRVCGVCNMFSYATHTHSHSHKLFLLCVYFKFFAHLFGSFPFKSYLRYVQYFSPLSLKSNPNSLTKQTSQFGALGRPGPKMISK